MNLPPSHSTHRNHSSQTRTKFESKHWERRNRREETNLHLAKVGTLGKRTRRRKRAPPPDDVVGGRGGRFRSGKCGARFGQVWGVGLGGGREGKEDKYVWEREVNVNQENIRSFEICEELFLGNYDISLDQANAIFF